MRLLVSTNAGLEELLSEEIAELLDLAQSTVESKWGSLFQVPALFQTLRPGLLLCELRAAHLESVAVTQQTANDTLNGRESLGAVESPRELPIELWDALAGLRLAHHIGEVLAAWQLPNHGALDDLEERVAQTQIPGLKQVGSFRVRCRRLGDHDFRSEDVERRAGAGVRRQQPVGVNLKRPQLDLRVDIEGERCLLMKRHSVERLSIRAERVHHQVAGAQAVVAAGLVRAMGATATDAPRVLDPFVGGGSLLMEAKERWPAAQLCLSDLDPRMVEGSLTNLSTRGTTQPPITRIGDARSAGNLWAAEAPFDLVLANPPWGRRMGERHAIPQLLDAFLRECARLLRPGGQLGMLCYNRRELKDLLVRHPHLWMEKERVVEAGGIWIGLFHFRRIS